MKRTSFFYQAVLFCVAAFGVTHVHALDLDWVGTDGLWQDGGNWSGGVQPNAADNANIAGLVTVESSANNNTALGLENDAGVTVTAGLLDILGQTNNRGTIAVTAGKLESNFLDNEAGGNILVDGASGELSVIVEFDNEGDLTVENGAMVELADITNMAYMTVRSGATVMSNTMENDIGSSMVIEDATSLFQVGGNTTNAGDFSVTDGAKVISNSFVNYLNVDITNALLESDSMFNAALGVIDLDGVSTVVTVNGNVTNQGEMNVFNAAAADFVSIGNEKSLTISSGARVDTISILNSVAGTITVENLNSALVLTDNLQSFGAVTVKDQAQLEALSIGNEGSLMVTSGATVVTESIANGAGKLIAIQGAGSRVELTNNLDNNGTIELSDNAELDTGSLVNNKALSVSSAATFNTTTLVNSASAEINASGAGSSISVGGVLENRGLIALAGGASLAAGSFEQFSGATTLDAGTLTSNGSGIHIIGGSLSGHGAIVGNLTSFSGGELSPGNEDDPSGVLQVEGDVSLGGVLLVDLQSLALDDFDQIIATGDVSLGGVLQVSLLDGYIPDVGDSFEILLGQNINGLFAQTLFPQLADGFFTLVVGPDFARLVVASAVPLPLPLLLTLLPSAFLLVFRRKR